jgi:anti-sigma factor RsiW
MTARLTRACRRRPRQANGGGHRLRGRHVINLFVWPGRGELGPAEAKPGDGYTLLHWTRGGMTFWAVSDVNEKDLQAFRQLLQARTPT